MNRRQWAVLIFGLALFSLSELFPPWLYEDGVNSAEQSAGYHLVFGHDPKVKTQAEMKRIFSLPPEQEPHGFSIRKDIFRLYGQRLSLLFLMSGLVTLLSKRKSYARKVMGRGMIFLGCVVSMLYLLYIFAVLGT